jgi:cyclophilin family peptidyl-prolyl cis-trans isomerase
MFHFLALLLVYFNSVMGLLKPNDCKHVIQVFNESLQNPCDSQMTVQSPEVFNIVFGTNYGDFTANCRRDRASAWVDRVYNLVLNGYYNDNYFFRVIPGKYAQFGTNGNPSISNCYNYQSPDLCKCGVILPQPDTMPVNTDSIHGLSNLFGTMSMSTSFNEATGTTWNATAELFINIGNNSQLDEMMFVPICTIDQSDMENTVLYFPSFGEVEELGGHGVSLDTLYAEGNSYIEQNSDWDTMAETTQVRMTCISRSTPAVSGLAAYKNNSDAWRRNDFENKTNVRSDINAASTCGPCIVELDSAGADLYDSSSRAVIGLPYEEFSSQLGNWLCPYELKDRCASAKDD